MSVESANYINELVRTNPKDYESPYFWADHIRLVKKAIKQTFPNWEKDHEITDFLKFINNISLIKGEDAKGIFLNSPKYKNSQGLKKNLMIHDPLYQSGDTNPSKLYPMGPLPPIGALIENLLTESQFLGMYPEGSFMICNGQGCIGTYYNVITGNTEVPDLRNRHFLRPTKDETKLGTFGDQGTNKNHLDIYAEWDNHGATEHDLSSGHYHDYELHGLYNPDGLYERSIASNGTYPPKDSINDFKDTDSANMFKDVTHDAADHNFQIASDDDETAPTHIPVNIFIRVN